MRSSTVDFCFDKWGLFFHMGGKFRVLRLRRPAVWRRQGPVVGAADAQRLVDVLRGRVYRRRPVPHAAGRVLPRRRHGKTARRGPRGLLQCVRRQHPFVRGLHIPRHEPSGPGASHCLLLLQGNVLLPSKLRPHCQLRARARSPQLRGTPVIPGGQGFTKYTPVFRSELWAKLSAENLLTYLQNGTEGLLIFVLLLLCARAHMSAQLLPEEEAECGRRRLHLGLHVEHAARPRAAAAAAAAAGRRASAIQCTR